MMEVYGCGCVFLASAFLTGLKGTPKGKPSVGGGEGGFQTKETPVCSWLERRRVLRFSGTGVVPFCRSAIWFWLLVREPMLGGCLKGNPKGNNHLF